MYCFFRVLLLMPRLRGVKIIMSSLSSYISQTILPTHLHVSNIMFCLDKMSGDSMSYFLLGDAKKTKPSIFTYFTGT